MIAWLPGDGNGNDIVGSNNGTPQNGAGFGAGKVAQAFTFGADGNDTVTLPKTSLHNAFSALSIDAWVYPITNGHDTQPGVGYYGRTVISNTEGDGFALRVKDGQIQADLRLTGGNVLYNFNHAPLPLNQWSHIALTFGNGQVTAYLNGVSVGSVAASGVIKNTVNAQVCTMIGNDPGGPSCTIQASGYGWHGSIDEVEIFNRVLSATEIQTIYNADSAGKCKPGQALLITPTPERQPSTFRELVFTSMRRLIRWAIV